MIFLCVSSVPRFTNISFTMFIRTRENRTANIQFFILKLNAILCIFQIFEERRVLINKWVSPLYL